MARFFVNRPIVAIVIAIITVILGIVMAARLPVAQFPNIVPPEIMVSASYIGADAETLESSVAAPIEQQMSGVDNMNYMYSTSASSGNYVLKVNFDVTTDPSTDQILTQMRQSQAESQLPSDVRNYGITVQKSTASPLLVFALYSPNGSYDSTFLANYAYINLNDQMLRVKGIASITVFGAGQYAMRCWVNPNTLAKLNITVPEILNAINTQNTVNPAGQVGSEPVPQGQPFTYTVKADGRLTSAAEFGEVIVRANPDGSMVRLKDVARIELGSQTYNLVGRLNGKPAAIVALYQMPDTNALAAAEGAKKLMADLKTRFPDDLDYVVALDTTLALTASIDDIKHTFVEAIILVIIVVFIFLQGWRATLIPLIAVPVSLVGTFAFFPMLGFSINTLSLLGLVLAIGLVVDDAIVVVEAVEHHIEKGLAPKEATIKAMSEVSSPVIAIALILSAVFLPTAFIPGISGSLYQQFAVTIALSVLLSAFNALTLSPALAGMLLRPKTETKGPLGAFYKWFNRMFGTTTNKYVTTCHFFIRKVFISLLLLVGLTVAAGLIGAKLPPGFLPEEDQGYCFAAVILPLSSSLQRTNESCRQLELEMMKVPGVEYVTTVVGTNFIMGTQSTYYGLFFISLKDWDKRKAPAEQYDAILHKLNEIIYVLPSGQGFAFSPPAIPGIGTAGGVTFVLEDRAGKDLSFLTSNVEKYLEAVRKRPEIGRASTTYTPEVPQFFVDVDRDKVLKQGIPLQDVYKTVQSFMGGSFVNYFNEFGRQWQVYVQAEGPFRTDADNVGQFYVRNTKGDPVPLNSLIDVKPTSGPEFIFRYNLYRSAQLNVFPKPGYSSGQVMKAMEEVFTETMPREMGYDYFGMSFQEKQAQEGVSPMVIFALSLLFVFLILAAQYESWSLPFSVLLGTPIAVFGAFLGLMMRHMENNIYAQIGLVMLIGLAAKNAILIVEFAKAELEKGRTPMDAALEGARLRLRPILMTAFAFILGCVPLAIATGSGALSRQILGTTVIGGMLASTVLAIFLVPVLFYLVEKYTSKEGAHHAPPAEPEAPAEKPAEGAPHV